MTTDDSNDSGMTATQISERWEGVTAGRVHHMVSMVGLSHRPSMHVRGDPPVFSPAAAALIERELQSRGYRRLTAAVPSCLRGLTEQELDQLPRLTAQEVNAALEAGQSERRREEAAVSAMVIREAGPS